MLMEANHQIKVLFLTIKYNIMREMTNKVTFLTNILFMMLNNAIFIIQWFLLFHLKDNIGGYKFSDVMVLWGLAASTFGFSNIFFNRAFRIPDLVQEGKLDSYLVLPKNVLLAVMSSGTSISAIGDLVYGYLVICIFNFSIIHLLLFTILTVAGGIILTAFGVIMGSLSFWITKGDLVAGNMLNIFLNVSTYPDGIFKGGVKLLLYTLIPVGLAIYMPARLIITFRLSYLFLVFGATVLITILAFCLFYRGLRRYTSSNLMSART